MAITLPTIDLTTATAGTTGTLDLKATGYTANPSGILRPASLTLFNDSGCGLSLAFLPSGNSAVLPAGAWRTYQLFPGDALVQYTVLYLIPNAPVSILLAEYFAPGEMVIPLGILGNSPVGIGGLVNTSSPTPGTQTVQEAVKSGTCTTGSVLGFTHGLSTVPDFSIVINSGTGHRVCAVTNYTTSTVDVYFPVATVNFLLYSIKIN